MIIDCGANLVIPQSHARKEYPDMSIPALKCILMTEYLTGKLPVNCDNKNVKWSYIRHSNKEAHFIIVDSDGILRFEFKVLKTKEE